MIWLGILRCFNLNFSHVFPERLETLVVCLYFDTLVILKKNRNFNFDF